MVECVACRVVDFIETGYIEVTEDCRLMVGQRDVMKAVDAKWGGRAQFGTVRVIIDLQPQTETSVGLDRVGNPG